MAYEHKENHGSLFKNDYKKEGDSSPDYKGQIMIGGKLMDIAAWTRKKEGKKSFFSLKISEPWKKGNQEQRQEDIPTGSMPEENLPF